ncbi:MAG: hypothetical protein HY268_25280 [Deltaproteobacteria bacterium]|nr:hypothetical protein [Deltaproteobacteria bacterium]
MALGHLLGELLKGLSKTDLFTTGDDGIVTYTSAHIEGVESELVVRFGHSVQGHPQASEEIRRILLKHLNEEKKG